MFLNIDIGFAVTKSSEHSYHRAALVMNVTCFIFIDYYNQFRIKIDLERQMIVLKKKSVIYCICVS